jgi:hypothetical protein
MERETITITEYAKRAKITRDGVYKQILNERLPEGVKVVKVAGRQFIRLVKS